MSEMSVNPAGAKETGELFADVASQLTNVGSDYAQVNGDFRGNDKFGDAFGANWDPPAYAIRTTFGSAAGAAAGVGGQVSATGDLFGATDQVNTELGGDLTR